MTERELIEKLEELVTLTGTRKAAADQLGIGVAHLGEILNGTRKPGRKVLEALGLERQFIYREKK